jgi:hypothetical protein
VKHPPIAQHLQQRSVAPPTRGSHTPTSTAVALVLRATCGARGRRRSTVTSSHPHPSKHRPPRHHHPAVRRQPARKGVFHVKRPLRTQHPHQPSVAPPSRGSHTPTSTVAALVLRATCGAAAAGMQPSPARTLVRAITNPPRHRHPTARRRRARRWVSRETSHRARVPSWTAVGSHRHPSPISTNTTGPAVRAPLDGNSASCRVRGSRSPTHSRLPRRVALGSPPIVTQRGYARVLGASVSRETFDSRRPRSARLAPSSPGVSAMTGPNRR